MWVQVIADDLTGACDVGAALRPLSVPVVIESLETGADTAGWTEGAIVVRNTQSRTLAPEAAAARVRRALAGVPAERDGIVFKKIDTALRGPLGAEIDAAMDAVGAGLALVLPAIPEVGRTTVGGRQLVDGIPVHETAFARDPQNPVGESDVAAVVAATSRRRVAGVSLAELTGSGARAAVARCRAEGTDIVVGDAETDADLETWMGNLLDGSDGYDVPLPLVLVGSTGLAKAWRDAPGAWLFDRSRRVGLPDGSWTGREGILIVSGSVHPATGAQLAHAAAAKPLAIVPVDPVDPIASGVEASARVRSGGVAALVAPSAEHSGGSEGILRAVAVAAAAALERSRPRLTILIGGETAYAVLGSLGHPRLRIDGPPPAPLTARVTIVEGSAAGMPVITKGGSTGPAERLTMLIGEAR